VGPGDLAVLVVRARRLVRLGLGHQHLPAAPAGRLVLVVPKGQPAPALRLSPGDRRVLAGLESPGGRPGQLGPQGQLRQKALEDLAVPSKPPTRSSRWQQGWSAPVASALPGREGHCACMATAVKQRQSWVNRGVAPFANQHEHLLQVRLRCKGMSCAPIPHSLRSNSLIRTHDAINGMTLK
jgi:hypothetical protein